MARFLALGGPPGRRPADLCTPEQPGGLRPYPVLSYPFMMAFGFFLSVCTTARALMAAPGRRFLLGSLPLAGIPSGRCPGGAWNVRRSTPSLRRPSLPRLSP